MKTSHIVYIFVAAVRRSFNSITASVGLLHHDNNWKAEFSEQHTQSLEEATIRMLTACIQLLKSPCTLHIILEDEAIARGCTQHDRRGPAKDSVWQAWNEFDESLRKGHHRIFGAAQPQPDHLLIQACHASALSTSYASAEDSLDSLLKSAPHLLSMETILEHEPNFPWAVKLIQPAAPQYAEADGSLPPFVGIATADRMDNMVSPSQLILIRRAGRAAGLQGEDLEEVCQSKLGCRTDDLNINAASWLTEFLRKRAQDSTHSHTQAAVANQVATGTHNIASA